MAKKLERDDFEHGERPYSKEQAERAIKDAIRHKESAAEFTGMHGQTVKQFTEKFGVHKKAFAWARTLYGMEEDKRATLLGDFLDMVEVLGLDAQREMFDEDAHDKVVRLGKKASGKGKKGEAPAPAAASPGIAGDDLADAMGIVPDPGDDDPPDLEGETPAIDGAAADSGDEVSADIDRSLGLH